MRRAVAALAVLFLAVAVAFAVPAGSGASPSAVAAAKCKRKHKHHHRRKRCRKSTGTSAIGGTITGPPGRLLATEREVSPSQLQLQLSRATLPAGSTIVEQYNAGSDPHNLVLERKGVAEFTFDTLDPGGDARQTLTLSKGTWTLYCSLLNHRDLGMQATLTVN